MSFKDWEKSQRLEEASGIGKSPRDWEEVPDIGRSPQRFGDISRQRLKDVQRLGQASEIVNS